jgi:radical SAM superfamily enzyme
LEIALFIPPNIFLGVRKRHHFRRKLLGTLGDALREKKGRKRLRLMLCCPEVDAAARRGACTYPSQL